MGGLFEDRTTTNASNTNVSGSWNQSNMMKDPRYANAMTTFFNTFNPTAVANSGQVDPLQTQAGINQGAVMPFLGGVGAQAGNIAMNGITPANIEQYRNQYAEMAIDPTIKAFDVMRDNAMSDIGGNAAAQGALGNRGNVQQAKNMWDAQNMPAVRKEIAQMMAQGYNTAAQTAGQSVNAQVAGLGAANQAAGAMTGANQTMSNMGEQQRLAGLTPFQIADLQNTGLLKSSTVYGQEGLGASAGTGTQTNTTSPNLGSILGGVLSFFARDGGAIKWPGYEPEGHAAGGAVDELPGYGFGGFSLGSYLDDAFGLPKKPTANNPASPGVYAPGSSEDPAEAKGMSGADIVGGIGQTLGALGKPKGAPDSSMLRNMMASGQAGLDARLARQMSRDTPGMAYGGTDSAEMYGTDVKGYPGFPKFETMNSKSFESFPVPAPSLDAPMGAAPQAQGGNEQKKKLAALMGMGMAGGMADGGVARLGEKVKMLSDVLGQLQKRNGGAATGESFPGYADGRAVGDPGGESEWRAGTTVSRAPPLEANVQNPGLGAQELKIQALEAELAKRNAGSAAPAAAPAKAPWSFSQGLLHKDSPVRQVLPMTWLDGGTMVGQAPTESQRRARLLMSLGNPKHNPFAGMGDRLAEMEKEAQGRQRLDQEAAALRGKIMGSDGTEVPTVEARRVAVEEGMAPARRGALEAQGEAAQIRIKGIEAADSGLQTQIQAIDRAQRIDPQGYTLEGIRHYDGQRDAARAAHRATILRLQGQDGSGTNPPIAPSAPRAPMPRVRSEEDLYKGQ